MVFTGDTARLKDVLLSRFTHIGRTIGISYTVLPLNHRKPRYLDVPYSDVHLPLNILPLLKNMNAVDGHANTQNSCQVRSLPDSAKWIAAEHEEMQ